MARAVGTTVIYEHAPDYSWARAKCSEGCGLTVTAELSPAEAKQCRALFGFTARKMRRQLRGQILTQMRRLGCEHVPTS